QRLRDELAAAEITADVRVIKVETEQAAQEHRFTGSPTIRVNGADIVPPPADTAYNLACRVYQWADGRFSPMPSPQMIRNALTQAK
ncbi:MAG: thioredoxin family protein, partial [Chloroflexota bacterium]